MPTMPQMPGERRLDVPAIAAHEARDAIVNGNEQRQWLVGLLQSEGFVRVDSEDGESTVRVEAVKPTPDDEEVEFHIVSAMAGAHTNQSLEESAAR